MNPTNKYKFAICSIFFNYLHDQISKQEMIGKLYHIEEQLQKETKQKDKNLWFKLSKDDTLATTINDIDFDLDSKRNRDYMLEKISSLDMRGDNLEVYFK